MSTGLSPLRVGCGAMPSTTASLGCGALLLAMTSFIGGVENIAIVSATAADSFPHCNLCSWRLEKMSEMVMSNSSASAYEEADTHGGMVTPTVGDAQIVVGESFFSLKPVQITSFCCVVVQQVTLASQFTSNIGHKFELASLNLLNGMEEASKENSLYPSSKTVQSSDKQKGKGKQYASQALSVLSMGASALIISAMPFHLDFKLLLVFVSYIPVAAAAPCPKCFGLFDTCDFVNTGTCVAEADMIANQNIISNKNNGQLKLGKMIANKFLRGFPRSCLDVLNSLARRPAPGAPFILEESTTSSQIFQAISNGQVALEAVIFALNDLADAVPGDAANAGERLSRLKMKLESIRTLKDTKQALFANPSEDSGYFTYVWAKASEYVALLDLDGAAVLETAAAGALAARSVYKATLHRPKTMEEFSEMLNMNMMYVTALGMATVWLLTQFYETVVYESIRLRRRSWQFAHELLLLCYRRIEDSGGRVNLTNVFEVCHMTTLFEEAERSVAVFFRTHAGNALQGSALDDEATKKAVKWNGKFSSTGRPCLAFNSGSDHKPSQLHPDGTCKGNHACDHWVDNKGKNGRCLSTSHARIKCDNPNKCKSCVQ